MVEVVVVEEEAAVAVVGVEVEMEVQPLYQAAASVLQEVVVAVMVMLFQ